MNIYQYLFQESIAKIDENAHYTIERYLGAMYDEQCPNVYLFSNNDNKESVNIIVTESIASIDIGKMRFAVRSNSPIGSYIALRRYVASKICLDIDRIPLLRYGTDEDSALMACEEIEEFLGDCQEKSLMNADMFFVNALSDAFKKCGYAFYETDRRIKYDRETKHIQEHVAYIVGKNGFKNFIEPCLPTIEKYFSIVLSEDGNSVMISLLSR